MPFLLTLVASEKPLSAAHLAGIERFIDQQGLALTGDPVWLHEHKAADLPIGQHPDADQMRRIREALSVDRIDVFCGPAHNRRKKLLVADMDSTITTAETLDELAERAGLKDKIAAITERAMNGELDFEAALKERVGLLAGLPEGALGETLAEIKISPGAEKLVRTMRTQGARCVLISGGFTFFTQAIARQAGFCAHYGNKLDVEKGTLTGKVGEPVLDKNAKLSRLRDEIKSLNLQKCDSLAIGDGANDLPMLEQAGLGIGYRPRPILAQQLVNQIRFADLSAALYAQGYTEEEIL